MRVELQDVAKGLALPSTSVAFASGEVAVAVAETEQRPTVLGLIASGRMRPASGLVLIDGREDAASLRLRVALVDAPSVSDPAPDVTVAGVTAEELMFAGRTANPIAVRRWLDAAGYGHLARVPFGDVSPRERIGLLLELTALRDGVEGIVLVSPDRHGGDPRESRELLQAFADRGLAILVIVGEAAAALLRLPVPVDPSAADVPQPEDEPASTEGAGSPLPEPAETTERAGSANPEPAESESRQEAVDASTTSPAEDTAAASATDQRERADDTGSPHPEPAETGPQDADATQETENEQTEEDA